MTLAPNFLFRLAPLYACATLASAQAGHPPDRLIDGLLYETTITTASSILPGPGMSSRMRTIEASGKVRTEVLQVSGAMPGAQANPMRGGPGSYTVTLEGGRVFGVDTIKREYFDVSVREMFASGSDMMKALQGMNVKISEEKFDAEDLGDGGVVLGHPTHRWKLRQSMTMSAQMMGDTMAITSEMTTETFYARDIERMASSPLDSTLLNTITGAMPMSDFKKSTAAHAKLPKTLPLKSIQKGLMLFGPMEVTITMTAEVTKIQKGRFSESLFRVPKGYKRVEMPFPKMPAMAGPDR